MSRKERLLEAVDNGFHNTLVGTTLETNYAHEGHALSCTVSGEWAMKDCVLDQSVGFAMGDYVNYGMTIRAHALKYFHAKKGEVYRFVIFDDGGFEFDISGFKRAVHPNDNTEKIYSTNWQIYNQTYRVANEGYYCVCLRKPNNSAFTLDDTKSVRFGFYKIEPRTVAPTDNLINYADLYTATNGRVNGDGKADKDGWYTIDIDATGQTSGIAWVRAWTPYSQEVKPDTEYYLLVETAEIEGDQYNFIVTNTAYAQQVSVGLSNQRFAVGESRIYKVKTVSDFTDKLRLTATEFTVSAGYKFHVKYRISMYEASPKAFSAYVLPAMTNGKGNLLNMKEYETGHSDGTVRDDRARNRIPIPVQKGYEYTIVPKVRGNFLFCANTSMSYEYPFEGELTYCGNTVDWQADEYSFVATQNGYMCVLLSTVDDTSFTVNDLEGVEFEVYAHKKDAPVGDKTDTVEPRKKWKLPIVNNGETMVTTYLDRPLGLGDTCELSADELYKLELSNGKNHIWVDTEAQPYSVTIEYTTRMKGDV